MYPILMLLGLALAVPAYAADEGTSKTTSGGVRKEAGAAIDSTVDKARQERDEFTAEVRKELDYLNVEIAELRKKAQEATRESKSNLDKEVRNLEQKQKLAERKFAELKSATGEKWRELKDGVSRTVNQLKQSVQKTREGSGKGS